MDRLGKVTLRDKLQNEFGFKFILWPFLRYT